MLRMTRIARQDSRASLEFTRGKKPTRPLYTAFTTLAPKLSAMLEEKINEQNGTAYKSEDVYFEFAPELMSNGQENAQIELTDRQSEQARINTLLSLNNVLDDETIIKQICEVLDLDYEEIKDRLPEEESESGIDAAQRALDGIKPEDIEASDE